MITEKEYYKAIKEIYPIYRELEELEFIQPRFLEIVNFYFDRYGFGIKENQPIKYIQFNKEYDLIRKRIDKLKQEHQKLNSKIKDFEEQKK